MGKWTRNSRGELESYFPDVGEIVSYPRSRGGVGIVTRCNGVLYDLTTEHGSNSPTGVWDMQPATEAEKARLRSKLDVSRVALDRSFRNAMPCGEFGHREMVRAAKARLERRMEGPEA